MDFRQLTAHDSFAVAYRILQIFECPSNTMRRLEKHNGARRTAKPPEPLIAVFCPNWRKA